MRNTEQFLGTAIGELKCLDPNRPASIDELTALSAARDCINELLRSCVTELRADPVTAPTWSAIAYALGASSASNARQRYGNKRASQDSDANVLVQSFWQDFAESFAWDFLPIGFLHALYVQWMRAEFQDEPHTPLTKETFTRRLKDAATASGEWTHTRSRPGSLMNAEEPLADLLPHWTHDGSDRALYGFRRHQAAA